jgi:hypothetical protein
MYLVLHQQLITIEKCDIMFKWRKEKIVFETSIPGMDKLMPIIPAKDYKHPWVNRALDDLANIRKNPNYGMESMLHTAKCPGIFKVQRHGWIVRTWQDIVIETSGDGESFLWSTPTNQIDLNKEDYISSHGSNQFHQYMNNWPENCLKTIIKIHTGWRCVVPKGYYLMEMPVAYSDEKRFTTLPGFSGREMGPAHLNVQMMWHVLNGKTLIKAGTPIAQYMLVPKKELQMEMKTIGEPANIHDLFELSNAQRFVKNFNETKELFGKD